MKKYAGALLVVVVFALGALIRLYDATDEPLEVHATRQLHSARIARGFYYQDNPDIPLEKRQFVAQEMDSRSLIEPSIIEWLSAQTYKLVGQEHPWIARYYSIAFWMLGGLALFSLTRDFSSTAGGVAAISFYFFLPFGVHFSRVFMPDPMMTAFTVIAIWALYQWEKRRTIPWALFAGLVTGYAILTKSVAGFILIFPFAFFTISSLGFKGALRNRQVWLIVFFAALPSAIYYYYGIVINGTLGSQFSGRFFPQMWSDPGFYVKWLDRLESSFGLITVLIGVFGIALARRTAVLWLLVGWWLGYIVYGFTFPYHLLTHVYYHLPLVPIIAATLAPAAAALYEKLLALPKPWFRTAILLTGLAVVVAHSMWTVRVELAKKDYRQAPEYWQSVAAVFTDYPNEKIIALSFDYGQQLSYYGELSTTHWSTIGDLNYQALQGKESTFEDRWSATDGFRFFLVTSPNLFERDVELYERLTNRYQIFAEGLSFVVYDLAAPK